MMTLTEVRTLRVALERRAEAGTAVVSNTTLEILFDELEATKRNLADARQRLVDLELDTEVGL